MTEEEINVLAEKIKDETSTPEEELKLLKFLNQGIDEMRTFVKEITKYKKVEELRNSILEK
ncbi:MAG: hypothetical protein Q8K92_00015 [Leadbetterella sp.]|nr:hypothetical protein [Leadbetterella sp.]